MTDLETLLRETLHAHADQAPLEHRVLARSLIDTRHRTSRRVRRLAGCAAAVGIAATVVAGYGASRHGDAPTATDGSTASAPPTTGPAILTLHQYTDAVTTRIVACLQEKGFAVTMDRPDEEEFTDGDGHAQLTFRVPQSLQGDPDYRAAGRACTKAAEAAVPSPPS